MKSNNIHDLIPDAPIITDDIRLALHRKYAQPYIFYKKYKNHIDCYCTACMHRFDVRRDIPECDIYGYNDYQFSLHCEHNAVVTCPICGVEAIARSEQMSRTSLCKWHMLIKWFVSEDGNIVHAVFGELCCGYGTRKPNCKELSISEMEQQYGGSEWYTKYVARFAKGEEPILIGPDYWSMYKVWNIREPYLKFGLYNSECFISDYDDLPDLKQSFLKYVLPKKLDSQSKVYSGTKIIEWLAMVQKYPIVETFCKCGGEEIIKSILDYKESYKRVLDFSADKLSGVFRCDTDTAAALQRLMYKGRLTLDDLKMRRLLERRYHKPMLAEMQELNVSVRMFKDCVLPVIAATGISVKQYINYINKQPNEFKYNKEWIATIYRDYINECIQLGYDPRENIVGRPRNLNEAHRRNQSAIQAIELEKEREREAIAAKGYMDGFYKQWCKHYEYTNGVWSIIVPKSASEIVAEGKALSHCVAGSAERHIDGRLTILFMRRSAEIEKSVYTIEMHGNQMIQVQGYQDRTPLTADAQAFFDKWLKWVRLSDEQKNKRRKSQKHKKESAA